MQIEPNPIPKPVSPEVELKGWVETKNEKAKTITVYLRKPRAETSLKWYLHPTDLNELGEIELSELESITKLKDNQFVVTSTTGLKKTFTCFKKGEKKTLPEFWIEGTQKWAAYHTQQAEFQKHENKRALKLKALEEEKMRKEKAAKEEQERLTRQQEEEEKRRKLEKEREERRKKAIEEWLQKNPKPEPPQDESDQKKKKKSPLESSSLKLKGWVETKTPDNKKIKVFIRKPRSEFALKWFKNTTDLHEIGEIDFDEIEKVEVVGPLEFSISCSTGLNKKFYCLKKGEEKTTPDFWKNRCDKWLEFYKKQTKWKEQYSVLLKSL